MNTSSLRAAEAAAEGTGAAAPGPSPEAGGARGVRESRPVRSHARHTVAAAVVGLLLAAISTAWSQFSLCSPGILVTTYGEYQTPQYGNNVPNLIPTVPGCAGAGGSGCGSSSGTNYAGTGNNTITNSDPVTTRGYPVTTDITVPGQVTEAGRPMANASFTYDIHLANDNLWTVEGVNAQTGQPECSIAQQWTVVDANATRLQFGLRSSAPTALTSSGCFSTLSYNNSTGVSVLYAGAPGHLQDAGNYVYVFNAAGQLTSITDPQGNVQTLNYAYVGNTNELQSVTDESTGKQVTFNWTGSYISSVVENGGAATRYLSYTSGSGGVSLAGITLEDALGDVLQSTVYAYNPSNTFHQVTSFERDNDPNSLVTYTYTAGVSPACNPPVYMANSSSSAETTHYSWTQLYPTSGNTETTAYEKLTSTNALGGVTTYNLNYFGNPITVAEPSGLQLTYTFLTTSNSEPATCTDGVAYYTYAYDAQGSATKVTRGPVTSPQQTGPTILSMAYASNGIDVTSISDALSSTSLSYGDPAQPHVATSLTDGNGNVWSFGHNAHGQPTTVTPPTGSPTGTSTLAYDENASDPTLGMLTSATDANGNQVTVDAYDTLNDPLQVSTYPITGNTSVRDTETFTYDGSQRVTKQTHPDGTSYQWNYTYRNLTSTTDEAGTQYDYSYCSPCGALTAISGPTVNGNTWSLGLLYDGDGNLSRFTDANGNKTIYGYTNADQLNSITYPSYGSRTMAYDTHGRLSSTTDAASNVISLLYDNVERVSSIKANNNTVVQYAYNTDDTVSSVTDTVGTTGYAYTGTKQIKTETYAYTGLSNTQTLQYTYYPNGLRETMSWYNGSTLVGTWSYSYDAGGRLTAVANSFGETTSYGYDGEDKITSQTDANGTSLSIGFDNQRGWVNGITYSNSSGVFAQYGLTYDGGLNTVGNLTQVVTTDDQGVGSSSTASYAYDPLYRLTSESHSGSDGSFSSSGGYDLAGNRTSWYGNTVSYYSGDQINDVNQTAVHYDPDGNLTGYLGNTYAWNYAYRLTSQTGSNGTVSYTYDSLGRRVTATTNGVTTYFIFDGPLLIGEISSGGSPNMAYTWGSAGLVSQRNFTTGASLWYAFGPQGETRELTNANGQVVDQYLYDAWGVSQSTSGSDYNPFLYGGRVGYYTDVNAASTGIVLCGARWYLPSAGTWLCRDPIGYAGGDNPYKYCSGNPMTLTDPSGMWFVVDDETFLAAGALWGVGGQALADMLQGRASSWQTYVGAAIGGAVDGECLLAMGPAGAAVAGGLGGLVGNGATQLLNNMTGVQHGADGGQLLASGIMGAAVGGLVTGPMSENTGAVNDIIEGAIRRGGSILPRDLAKLYDGIMTPSGLFEGSFVGAMCQQPANALGNAMDAWSLPGSRSCPRTPGQMVMRPYYPPMTISQYR